MVWREIDSYTEISKNQLSRKMIKKNASLSRWQNVVLKMLRQRKCETDFPSGKLLLLLPPPPSLSSSSLPSPLPSLVVAVFIVVISSFSLLFHALVSNNKHHKTCILSVLCHFMCGQTHIFIGIRLCRERS